MSLQSKRLPVLIIFGPTAVGKSELLDRLVASGRLSQPIEIVSADSRQVYRGLDIGTAKPDAETRRRLPHHLLDIRNPDEQFNVGDFVRLADKACLEIVSRAAWPVLAGGTGFYLRNFVLGLPASPPADPELRDSLKQELAEGGPGPLLAELAARDPASAQRIHPNDHYRLLRALEVIRQTGRPLSTFAVNRNLSPKLKAEVQADSQADGSPRPTYKFRLIALRRSRAELQTRIEQRVRTMFDSGLRAELIDLTTKGWGPADPGLRAIGYKEFFDETGQLRNDDQAIAQAIIRNSRLYAKRQETYFKSLPEVQYLDAAQDANQLVNQLAWLKAKGSAPKI